MIIFVKLKFLILNAMNVKITMNEPERGAILTMDIKLTDINSLSDLDRIESIVKENVENYKKKYNALDSYYKERARKREESEKLKNLEKKFPLEPIPEK